MLNLAHLQTFFWVAKLGSFREAAQRTQLTQPAISIRIRDLESELGAKLFDRGGRRVRLTPSGAHLLTYAEKILTLADEAAEKIHQGSGIGGLLRVGTVDSLAITCLPGVVSTLTGQYPSLRINLTVAYSYSLADRLTHGDVDVAFLYAPPESAELITEPLHSISLCWIASPAIAVRQGLLRASDLAKLSIIVPGIRSNYQHLCLEWLTANGVSSTSLSTCSNLTATISLVKSGFGVSLVPICLVEEDLAAGALAQLAVSPAVPPQMLFATRARDRTEPYVRSLCDLTRGALAGLEQRYQSVSKERYAVK